MTDTDNDAKRPTISKKWLYGSLAVAALLIGLFLESDAMAAETIKDNIKVASAEINYAD